MKRHKLVLYYMWERGKWCSKKKQTNKIVDRNAYTVILNHGMEMIKGV